MCFIPVEESWIFLSRKKRQALRRNYINEVRVVEKDGEPWFVAKDVCDVLELSDVNKTTARLDDDEKLGRKIFVSGQNRDVITIRVSEKLRPLAFLPFTRVIGCDSNGVQIERGTNVIKESIL